MDEYRALSIGIAALAAARESVALEALAVFDRSLYLADGRGRVLCLLGPGMEPGPLHLIVDRAPASFRSVVSVGDAATVGPQRLACGGLAVDLTGARLWDPPPLKPAKPAADFVENRLVPALLAAAPADALFRTAFGKAAERPADPLWEALKKATAEGLSGLGAWLRDPAGEAPPVRLLGLGHGLTPSGDDILAGAMLALHAVGEGRLAGALASALEPLLDSGTNRVSAAHLRAAGLGRGAAVFHDCLRCILGREAPVRELARVDAVGHGSGWDALLGMVWTLGGVARGRS